MLGFEQLTLMMMGNAIASTIIMNDDSDSDAEPVHSEQRFIRPPTGFVDFLEMQRELPDSGDSFYKDNFRLPLHVIDLLVKMCKKYIPRRMDIRTVILVTLQWLATGLSVRTQEAAFMRQSYSQLSLYRRVGVQAILKATKEHGIYGADPHERDRIIASTQAFAKEHPVFGRCIGALDGTHVPLIVPTEMTDKFRNRKGRYIITYCLKNVLGYISTNVLGVVDEMGRFISVFAGADGCASDGFVYNHVQWEQLIPDGYFYLADAGFKLTKKLLTPYRSTRYHLREWAVDENGRPQTPSELFNYRHSKARIIVERAFGILKKKWRVLGSPMELDIELSVEVIHACCALHNLCIEFSPDFVFEFGDNEVRQLQDEMDVLHIENTQDPHVTAESLRDKMAQEMWAAYLYYRQNN